MAKTKKGKQESLQDYAKRIKAERDKNPKAFDKKYGGKQPRVQ